MSNGLFRGVDYEQLTELTSGDGNRKLFELLLTDDGINRYTRQLYFTGEFRDTSPRKYVFVEPDNFHLMGQRDQIHEEIGSGSIISAKRV